MARKKKKRELIPFKCEDCGHIQLYWDDFPKFIFGHCYNCMDCKGFKIFIKDEN